MLPIQFTKFIVTEFTAKIKLHYSSYNTHIEYLSSEKLN